MKSKILFPILITFLSCSSSNQESTNTTNTPHDSIITNPDTLAKIYNESDLRGEEVETTEFTADLSVLNKETAFYLCYQSNLKTASGEYIVKTSKVDESIISYDGTVHVTVDSIIEIKPKERAIVVFSSKKYEDSGVPEYCHACGVNIGMADLIFNEGKWQLASGSPYMGMYGSWSAMPSYTLKVINDALVFLVLKSGFSGQGYTSENDIIIPVGKYKEALNINTHDDNYGAVLENDPSQYAWDAQCTWIYENTTLQLNVNFSGTRMGEKEVEPMTGNGRYFYNTVNGLFERAKF